MFTTITLTHKPFLRICLWFSIVIALLLFIVTTGGLFLPGLYRDTPTMVVQAHGQDLATLLIGLPLFIGSFLMTIRGSDRALIVWLGSAGYILYSYLVYAFSAVFNEFFLFYVAIVSLSFFTLVILLLNLDIKGLKLRFGPKTPLKVTSIYLLVVGSLIFLSWMKEIVPALISGKKPDSLVLAGIPTNPVHVLDLSVMIPLTFIVAIWLWRKDVWGYILSGLLLINLGMLGLAVSAMGLFMYQANDPGFDLVFVSIFLIIAVTSLVLAFIHIANIRPKKEVVISNKFPLGGSLLPESVKHANVAESPASLNKGT